MEACMTYVDEPRHPTGPNEPWGVTRDGEGALTAKFKRTYGAAGLVINYRLYLRGGPKKNIGPTEFGKIVDAIRLARNMLDVATLKLSNISNLDDNTSASLKYHFNIDAKSDDQSYLKIIKMRFNQISEGLKEQVVICATTKLSKSTRGETTPHKPIHINKRILADCNEAIARTIIHESAHKFSGVKSHYGETYCGNIRYRDEHPSNAIDRADSYAWVALSLYNGRPLSHLNFENNSGVESEANEEGDFIPKG
jgi:hypothetical protein